MVDRTTELAQSVAERLSRRGFLGRVGRGAAVAAGALGGLLMIPGDAEAGKRCYTNNQCPRGQFCGWDGRCHKPKRNPKS